jgi:transcriptional repressor NrdR
MVCIYCGSSTGVVNSRPQKRNNQIWRRRKCKNCSAIFSTLEVVDLPQALSVRRKDELEPFSRDALLFSVYESVRHRKTAMTDATAVTGTILSQLYALNEQAVVERDTITEIAAVVLERFDPVAGSLYRAFHPTD